MDTDTAYLSTVMMLPRKLFPLSLIIIMNAIEVSALCPSALVTATSGTLLQEPRIHMKNRKDGVSMCIGLKKRSF
jgi:hypothetical protein